LFVWSWKDLDTVAKKRVLVRPGASFREIATKA